MRAILRTRNNKNTRLRGPKISSLNDEVHSLGLTAVKVDLPQYRKVLRKGANDTKMNAFGEIVYVRRNRSEREQKSSDLSGGKKIDGKEDEEERRYQKFLEDEAKAQRREERKAEGGFYGGEDEDEEDRVLDTSSYPDLKHHLSTTHDWFLSSSSLYFPPQHPSQLHQPPPSNQVRKAEFHRNLTGLTIEHLGKDEMDRGLFLIPHLFEEPPEHLEDHEAGEQNYDTSKDHQLSFGCEEYSRTFQLDIYTNVPAEISLIDRYHQKLLKGRWDRLSRQAGGSHLHPDSWSQNPKFFLHILTKGPRTANVIIKLFRSSEVWGEKVKSSPVNTMMGFYMYPGQGAPFRDHDAIIVDGQPFTETPFRGGYHISTPPFFSLNPHPEEGMPLRYGDETGGKVQEGGEEEGNEEEYKLGYTIMPTTMEPNIEGDFYLQVESDLPFELSSY